MNSDLRKIISVLDQLEDLFSTEDIIHKLEDIVHDELMRLQCEADQARDHQYFKDIPF